MDFVVGILLMIIIILILYNFASISMSNNNYGSGTGSGSGSYNSMITQYNSIPYPSPSPILASSPSALNNKVNLNAQAYDYKKYFFV